MLTLDVTLFIKPEHQDMFTQLHKHWLVRKN